MRLPDFKLERYFAEYEFDAPYLLCCSDCESMSVGELLNFELGAQDSFHELSLGYTEAPGAPSLRREVSLLYSHASPEQIIIHAGAEEAIFSFVNSMLEPGDHIIVQQPCYQSLYQIAETIGVSVTPWRLLEENGWSADIDELATLITPRTKALLINSPHNPTGATMSTNALKRVANLADQYGLIVFSDEVYRLLEYDTETAPPMVDLYENAVSLGVMSKTYGLAGLRIGWVASQNDRILKRMAAFKDYVTICNSAPSEFLAELALRHGEKITDRNIQIILENLLLLNSFFNRRQDQFNWTAPSAGPIGFPSLKEGDAEEFCRAVQEHSGVLLLPGTMYDPNLEQNFRIGFGRKNMPDCLQRLDACLDEL